MSEQKYKDEIEELKTKIRVRDQELGFRSDELLANAIEMVRMSERIAELEITQPASGATEREKNLEATMCCPISNDLFKEPVLCKVTGHSFEKESIQTWLLTNDLCPLTRKKMTSADLVPNYTLAGVVAAYKIQQLIISLTWEDESTATLKVTNMNDKIQTLLPRLDHPLRHLIPNPDLNNTVFSLEAYGPALDMNSTFATVFGPTAKNLSLYIVYLDVA